MDDYDDAVRSGFNALVKWHFGHGTRPLRDPKQGEPWTSSELAYACFGDAEYERRVRYWLQKTVPTNLGPVQKAFLGDQPSRSPDPYEKFRTDLQNAYAKAKGAGSPRKETVEKLVLDDPRVEGRHLGATVRLADSLVAKFERDDFLERNDDLAFLDRFLVSGATNDVTKQFRWTVVTGPAGAGKTRLAIQFLNHAETKGFQVGFLELTNLKEFDARAWKPIQPTFIVVDYAAQSPDDLAKMIRAFTATACDSGFERPVRILILERDVDEDEGWFKTIAPKDSLGASVRTFCYREQPERWGHRLAPLTINALLAIMRGRLPDFGAELPDDLLLETLFRVDPPPISSDRQLTPRPLFAAATALKIADMMESGDNISTAISGPQLSNLQQRDVLAWIIDRERLHFWTEGTATDKRTENERLRVHENLLIVVTMALGMSRQSYDDQCLDASPEFLPNWRTFDESRFKRMAGGDPVSTLRPLEPDILGEFYVLDGLKKRPTRERQALVDTALSLGGRKSAIFLTRCAVDFTEQWHDLQFLRPSVAGPALRTFVHAAINWTVYLERFDLVESANSAVKELVYRSGDPSLHEPLAAALTKQAIMLHFQGRSEEAIAAFDEIVTGYGMAAELKLREQVGVALVSKGVALDGLKRSEEAIAVYDDLISRYGNTDELPLREQVAMALVFKSMTLDAMGRSEDAIAACDDAINRYGAASEPGLREQVVTALVRKGIGLAGLERWEEAITVYDDVINRYGTASEPALCKNVVEASIQKAAVALKFLGGDEAIAALDSVVRRYGATADPELLAQVAKALFGKAAILRLSEHSEEAIMVFNDLITRYSTASEPQLREQVANALHNKAAILIALERGEEAISVYDDLIIRHATADDPAEREQITDALYGKAHTLNVLGRHEEAIEVSNDLISRNAAADDLTAHKHLAQALVNKALALGSLKLGNEAIATCDTVVSRFGAASEPELLTLVANALRSKAATLDYVMRRGDEAITVYNDLIIRFSTSESLALREQVADALYSKAVILSNSGHNEEAITTFTDLLGRFGNAREPELRQWLLNAVNGLAVIVGSWDAAKKLLPPNI